jgi:aminocarboxymuconate-semialdehyde decarboxylase
MPIDVHAHYVPPSIVQALESRAADFRLSLVGDAGTCSCAIHFDYGLKLRPFFPKLVEPLDKRLTSMEAQGVDRQVLSTWGDIFGYGLRMPEASTWHRFLNEHLSRVCERKPDRFSLLASVPLPDAAAAAAELRYAVSHLGAVGVVVAANVAGQNLGELPLDEFWQAAVELDVGVFIHPVEPQPSPRATKFGLVQSAQYTYDTTLCVGSLIFSGVLDRFPNVRILLSHGGGAFPYLSGRFDCMHERMDRIAQGDVAAQRPSDYLTRFYYDTILHDPSALRWLAEKVTTRQIVLGTDDSFPPADRDPIGTAKRAGFDGDTLQDMCEANPRRLFPRLPGV